MKVALFGASGFVGSAVYEALRNDHEVFRIGRSEAGEDNEFKVDLLANKAIETALTEINPDVIINAAGIVDTSQDTTLNEAFTRNILEATHASGVTPKLVLLTGSAGVYGEVDSLPVAEDAPLRASAGYGLAKLQEEKTAHELGAEYNQKVVVTRIFNPIGKGMAEKFFVVRVKKQIQEAEAGERDEIEISRKDSLRDYTAVEDVADAIRRIVEGNPAHDVYNIGSGIPTSNGELLQIMLKDSTVEDRIGVTETLSSPEPLVAGQADVTRIKEEFSWRPTKDLADVVKEIMADGPQR